MAVLIKNGTIVTAEGERKADIYAEGESITAIGEGLRQRKVMKSLMQRVNTFYLAGLTSTCTFPSPTRAARPGGFETSNAAAVGGTTTLIEFVNQEQGRGLVETLDDYRKNDAEGIAMVDYAFHSVMTDPRDEVIEEIPKLAEAGYPTMKLFMAYKGQFFHADDDALLKALQKGKDAGVTIMVHAENADMIEVLTNQLIAKAKQRLTITQSAVRL